MLDSAFLSSAETPYEEDVAPQLSRRASEHAEKDLLSMDLEHQYDRRYHEEAVKRLSAMFRREISSMHANDDEFHDCVEHR